MTRFSSLQGVLRIVTKSAATQYRKQKLSFPFICWQYSARSAQIFGRLPESRCTILRQKRLIMQLWCRNTAVFQSCSLNSSSKHVEFVHQLIQLIHKVFFGTFYRQSDSVERKWTSVGWSTIALTSWTMIDNPNFEAPLFLPVNKWVLTFFLSRKASSSTVQQNSIVEHRSMNLNARVENSSLVVKSIVDEFRDYCAVWSTTGKTSL